MVILEQERDMIKKLRMIKFIGAASLGVGNYRNTPG